MIPVCDCIKTPRREGDSVAELDADVAPRDERAEP